MKDFLIFLFFLFVSSSLWSLHALRKDYETVIQIPLKYENLPQGYVQSEKLPDKLRITITDRGTSLLNYRLGKFFFPISIDMSDYVDSKVAVTSTMKSLIQRHLNTGTQIVSIKPDSLIFKFHKLKYKKVPVKIIGKIDLERQYTLCDSIVVNPREVTIYAPENMLDTISFAYTEPVNFLHVKDTLSQKVNLVAMPNVEYSESEILVEVKTEMYTEKMLQVPIYVENLPDGLNLRIFPSYVDLSFYVGISRYEKVDASSFFVSVDYNDISGENRKLPIKLKGVPNRVFHIQLKQKNVDYLVEDKK